MVKSFINNNSPRYGFFRKKPALIACVIAALLCWMLFPARAAADTPAQAPVIYRNSSGDRYVDLAWNISTGTTYYIKYSIADDRVSAANDITIPADSINPGASYRLPGLTPDTAYYIWIRSSAPGVVNGYITEVYSLWSNTLTVRTQKYGKMDVPASFRLSSASDAVAKDKLSFVWAASSAYGYSIELARDVSFNDSAFFDAGNTGSYTVTGLDSNILYYARLYAVDTDTGLKSKPTDVVSARTLKSAGEYNSNTDIEDLPEGCYMLTATGTSWIMDATGIYSHRLLEKARSGGAQGLKLDFSDASSAVGTKTVRLTSGAVDSLSFMGKRLMLDNRYVVVTLPPDWLDTYSLKKALGSSFNIEITLEDFAPAAMSAGRGLALRSSVCALSVTATALNGLDSITVSDFAAPVTMSFVYTDKSLFNGGLTGGYVFDGGTGEWNMTAAVSAYDGATGAGTAAIRLDSPGRAALMSRTSIGGLFGDVRQRKQQEAIMDIMGAFDLKSLEGSRYFHPDSNITLQDALAVLFDILGSDYGDDPAKVAAKAGFITRADASKGERLLTKGDFGRIFDRFILLLTGEKPESLAVTGKEAAKNITRGDFIILLRDVLRDAGAV